MAFQQDFETRLLTMDPLAGNWLMGISWQYAVPADADWPRLPHPGSWTVARMAVPENNIPQAVSVITKPLPVIRSRADLERDMADEDKRFRVSGTDFAATEAGSCAATQPAPLN